MSEKINVIDGVSAPWQAQTKNLARASSVFLSVNVEAHYKIHTCPLVKLRLTKIVFLLILCPKKEKHCPFLIVIISSFFAHQSLQKKCLLECLLF